MLVEEVSYLQFIIWISIGGYLLGSVLFCKILPKAVRGIDIEAVSEDGNPGTSNVFKYCGIPLGIVCAICDFAKAAAPIIVAYQFIPPEARTPLFGLVVCSGVLGHIFSIFHRGNGGMGVGPIFGTLFGIFFQCQLIFALIIIYVVFRYIARIKLQHLRTFLCFSTFFAFVTIFLQNPAYKSAYMVMSGIICAKCIYVAARQRSSARAEL